MVSPWSKMNYVDHTLTDQSSLLRFILDPVNGTPLRDERGGY
jgi:hypothetical protein